VFALGSSRRRWSRLENDAGHLLEYKGRLWSLSRSCARHTEPRTQCATERLRIGPSGVNMHHEVAYEHRSYGKEVSCAPHWTGLGEVEKRRLEEAARISRTSLPSGTGRWSDSGLTSRDEPTSRRGLGRGIGASAMEPTNLRRPLPPPDHAPLRSLASTLLRRLAHCLPSALRLCWATPSTTAAVSRGDLSHRGHAACAAPRKYWNRGSPSGITGLLRFVEESPKHGNRSRLEVVGLQVLHSRRLGRPAFHARSGADLVQRPIRTVTTWGCSCRREGSLVRIRLVVALGKRHSASL